MIIRAISAGMLVTGLAVLTAAPSHAQAFNDRPSTFGPIMGFLGVGSDNTEDSAGIDFRERPPLVVPKNLDLPAPQPGARTTRAANWPQDQDVVRRREEAARARVPQQIEVNKNPALTKQELMQGRSDDAPTAVNLCDNYTNGAPDCAPTAMDKIKRVFTLGGDSPRDVVMVGKEPDRKYLTEPPKGFRNASKTTKATMEGGYERPDNSDPKLYLREQALRDQSYR